MAPLDASKDAELEASIRDLLARTPPAPRDPLRSRILNTATGPEALLAALQFAESGARKRR